MSNSLKNFLVLAVAAVSLAGCPSKTVDRCSGADAHPECEGNNGDSGTSDAGSDAADAGDTGPDTGPADTGELDMFEITDIPLPCGGECADPVPFCNSRTQTCVGCLTSANCTDGVCSDAFECVECNETVDCAAGLCDPATNACVECLTNDECPDPAASACDASTNTCVPCTASTDCAHLPGTTVCDAGECVECTGLEYGACGGFVCDSRQRTCTMLDAQDAGLCEECVSDAQCRPGMVCVPMTFPAADGSGDAEVGTYCLWRQDSTEMGAPNGACSTVRPYVDSTLTTTIDGEVDVSVCGLRQTTCPGLVSFDSGCATAGVHDDCGAVGFDDAFCVMFDAAANLCTVPCGGDNDCESGFQCDTTVTPRRCEL